jgi:hypothetical protein
MARRADATRTLAAAGRGAAIELSADLACRASALERHGDTPGDHRPRGSHRDRPGRLPGGTQLLVETMVGFTDDPSALGARPVATIAAPVFDDNGGVTMILALHPLRPQTTDEVAAIGRRLTRAAETLEA